MSSKNSNPGRGSEPTVVVYHGPEAEDGSPLEPEEQAAEVVQPIDAVVTLGHGAMRSDVPIPRELQDLAANQQGHIVHTATAGELAASVRERCKNCVHFNQAGWGRLLREAEASGDKQRLSELNNIRAAIAENMQVSLDGQHDLDKSGDIDLEHALKALGFCGALTEHLKETIIVSPIGACPDGFNFFKPKKGREAQKAASSGYDWILNRAAGKKE